jgi:hypothetical protein
MPEDKSLKSAYELAMERLRAQDRARGEKVLPLNEAQKREIARLREEARAKLAELEIMHRKNLAGAAGDAEKLREIEEHFRIDRQRIEASLESRIAKIKGRRG